MVGGQAGYSLVSQRDEVTTDILDHAKAFVAEVNAILPSVNLDFFDGPERGYLPLGPKDPGGLVQTWNLMGPLLHFDRRTAFFLGFFFDCSSKPRYSHSLSSVSMRIFGLLPSFGTGSGTSRQTSDCSPSTKTACMWFPNLGV